MNFKFGLCCLSVFVLTCQATRLSRAPPTGLSSSSEEGIHTNLVQSTTKSSAVYNYITNDTTSSAAEDTERLMKKVAILFKTPEVEELRPILFKYFNCTPEEQCDKNKMLNEVSACFGWLLQGCLGMPFSDYRKIVLHGMMQD